MSVQFFEPCICKIGFTTLAYLIASLAAYNILGWKNYSFRFLWENLLHCLLASSVVVKRFEDLPIYHPKNWYVACFCLFVLSFWKFLASYSVSVFWTFTMMCFGIGLSLSPVLGTLWLLSVWKVWSFCLGKLSWIILLIISSVFYFWNMIWQNFTFLYILSTIFHVTFLLYFLGDFLNFISNSSLRLLFLLPSF